MTADTFGEFVRSPGFGGLAAVVAAGIAFWAAARSRRAEDARAREERWWEQGRWAVELLRAADHEGSELSARLAVAALEQLVDEAPDAEAARFARSVVGELLPQEMTLDQGDSSTDTGHVTRRDDDDEPTS